MVLSKTCLSICKQIVTLHGAPSQPRHNQTKRQPSMWCCLRRETTAPLKGRAFKIQKNLCAVLSPITWQLRHSNKRRCANIWRSSEAKHCSSLCSQSEGDEYCGGQALKIQQSYAPERWPCSLRVRGPHFASKVSYNAGAATALSAALRGLSPFKAFTLPANNEVWKQSEYKKARPRMGACFFLCIPVKLT